MIKIVNRTIVAEIRVQQMKFPVLALTGPRQSGKTTLLKNLFPDYEYVSLENPDTRLFAAMDPVAFLQAYNHNVILDEAQRVPELFSYIQTKVDEEQKMGQYILSGSQNFHLMKNITQSLAGRVALFKLLPFDFEELKSEDMLKENFEQNIVTGSYPAIYMRNIDPKVFYSNYIQTYIEKDVTQLINIRDLKTFRTFLKICAGRAAQLLNMSNIANECDISHTTAAAWLSVLESSYIVFLLQPYHENFNKRVVKSPKLYFYDTGLLSYMLGLRSADDVGTNRMKGNLFENMIVAEAMKKNHHHALQKEFFFWQDSNGNEIDLLEREHDQFYTYEIKSSKTIGTEMFKQMDRFELLALPVPVRKTLIYAGAKDQKRTKYTISAWNNFRID